MKWARLLYLLAHCAALSVGSTRAKVDRLVHAQSLPQALPLHSKVVYADRRELSR
jgi:hypothetical protein